jgi:integrase
MKGHIEQLGPDRWKVRVHRGHNKYVVRNVRGKKKDAQAVVRALITAKEEGRLVTDGRTTVAALLTRWIEHENARLTSRKTAERQAEIVRCHLIPALGHFTLAALTGSDIDAYYDTALKSGRRDGRGGLARQTVVHHHRALFKALRQAMRWRLVGHNAAADATPPRPDKAEIATLDERGMKRLIEMTAADRFGIPILLAIVGGLRRGEALGARWADVNLDSATLAVRQSIEQTSAGLRFKEPKGKRARTIKLPSLMVTRAAPTQGAPSPGATGAWT